MVGGNYSPLILAWFQQLQNSKVTSNLVVIVDTNER